MEEGDGCLGIGQLIRCAPGMRTIYGYFLALEMSRCTSAGTCFVSAGPARLRVAASLRREDAVLRQRVRSQGDHWNAGGGAGSALSIRGRDHGKSHSAPRHASRPEPLPTRSAARIAAHGLASPVHVLREDVIECGCKLPLRCHAVSVLQHRAAAHLP